MQVMLDVSLIPVGTAPYYCSPKVMSILQADYAARAATLEWVLL